MQITSFLGLSPSAFGPLKKDVAEKFAASDFLAGLQGPPPGIIPDNHPSQVYAQVKVGGEVVATIYNSGGVESSNALGGRIHNLVAEDAGQGPDLAADRAARIAKMLGGTVEKANTAMEQGEWGNWKRDRDQSLASFYNTTGSHIAAQATAPVAEEDTKLDGASSVKTSAADEFRDFMKKTPEERMIDQIMKSLGISKEEFDAMSPEQQTAVMNKIKELIEEKIRQATGIEGNGSSGLSAGSAT